jgi:hypothetical protein
MIDPNSVIMDHIEDRELNGPLDKRQLQSLLEEIKIIALRSHYFMKTVLARNDELLNMKEDCKPAHDWMATPNMIRREIEEGKKSLNCDDLKYWNLYPKRVRNVLMGVYERRLSNLSGFPEKIILSQKGIGWKTVRMINCALRFNGLKELEK